MIEIPLQNLPILKFCLVLLFLIPFPALAFFFGGSLLSLSLSITEGLSKNHHSGHMANEMVQGVLLKKTLGFLLWVLVGWTLFLTHLIYRPPLFGLPFWVSCLAILAAGILAMYTYSFLLRSSQGLAIPLFIGSSGLAMVTLALATLFCAGALLYTPEKWPLLPAQPSLLFSWAGAAGFFQFLALSLATTGITIVLGYKFKPAPLSPTDNGKTSRGAPIFMVLGLILWPPLVLFEIFSLSRTALTTEVLALFIIGALLALATCWLGLSFFINPLPKPTIIPIITLLGIFFCSALAHHLMRENILHPPTTEPSAETISITAPAGSQLNSYCISRGDTL
ncbi:MAG: hypothetical protein JXK94_02665 [Deltaproteobacteria bacterium]|nr:hypothetical protein [Deltaproteobacteria bacterium]